MGVTIMTARSHERGHEIMWLPYDDNHNLLGEFPTFREALDKLVLSGTVLGGTIGRSDMHDRGHLIAPVPDGWVYTDTGEPTSDRRPCKRCKCHPTPEGHDACLGHIPGATGACCGHGVEDGYIFYEDGRKEVLRNE